MLHNNGIVTLLVKNIFQCLGITITTLGQANTIAQEQFLRVGERWQTQAETDIYKRIITHKNELTSAFQLLGFIDTQLPTNKKYEYALIMGTVKDDAIDCLNFLTQLYAQEYTFKKIILLTGQRALLENEKIDLPSGLTTEAQMMLSVCQHAPILKNQNIILINAPMIQKGNGILARPTTEDTLKCFKKTLPQPGTCLVISHNPYIKRQTCVTKRILDQSTFPVEGCGPALYIQNDLDIIMLMDEFARLLYEEYKAYNTTTI